jgi:hypothetical protein
VTLSDNVISFGQGCFAQSGLPTFICPPKITVVPKELCYSCVNLSKADLSKATSLISIGEDAFNADTHHVVIDNTLYEYKASALKSVILP